jgi:hypothetical protein
MDEWMIDSKCTIPFSTDVCNNLDKSSQKYAQEKKPITKVHSFIPLL